MVYQLITPGGRFLSPLGLQQLWIEYMSSYIHKMKICYRYHHHHIDLCPSSIFMKTKWINTWEQKPINSNIECSCRTLQIYYLWHSVMPEFNSHYLINLIQLLFNRHFHFINSESKNPLPSSHSQMIDYFEGKQRLTLCSRSSGSRLRL